MPNLVTLMTYDNTNIKLDRDTGFIDLTSLVNAYTRIRNVDYYLDLPPISRLTEQAASMLSKPVMQRIMVDNESHIFSNKTIALSVAMHCAENYYIKLVDALDTMSTADNARVTDRDAALEKNMTALVEAGISSLDMSTKAVNLSGAVAVGVGEGILALNTKLSAIRDNFDTNINMAIDAALRNPKMPYTGKRPQDCDYNTDLFDSFKDFVNWLASGFSMAPNAVYDVIYHNYARIYNINLRTYKTAYARELTKFLAVRKLRTKEKPSMVRVAFQLGILDQIFQLAWKLSAEGTRMIPYQGYVSVDEAIYPINLTPRGRRTGMPLFPAAYYVTTETTVTDDLPQMASERFSEAQTATTLGQNIVDNIEAVAAKGRSTPRRNDVQTIADF